MCAMSAIDWKRLSPHLPLEVGDERYIERPWNGGARLAALIKAGLGPVAIAGPVGVGKSTELAAAANALREELAVLFLPLDRLLDMRALRGADILRAVVQLIDKDLGIERSPSYIEFSTDRAISEIRDFARCHKKPRATLLVDGIEKCPEPAARRAVETTLDLSAEADLVVVVPAMLVTGPAGHQLLTHVKRVFPIRPIPQTDEGTKFLLEMVRRRLGGAGYPQGEEFVAVLSAAAAKSGGIPRIFLQLVQDAAGFASLNDRDLPTLADLADAIQDHQDSLRRLLRQGDREALREADGSDGIEMELERRVRLLSHGLLLEYEEEGRPVVHPHPLLVAS